MAEALLKRRRVSEEVAPGSSPAPALAAAAAARPSALHARHSPAFPLGEGTRAAQEAAGYGPATAVAVASGRLGEGLGQQGFEAPSSLDSSMVEEGVGSSSGGSSSSSSSAQASGGASGAAAAPGGEPAPAPPHFALSRTAALAQAFARRSVKPLILFVQAQQGL